LTTAHFHLTTRLVSNNNVRGASLANFIEVAAQVGADAFALMREAGVDRRALTEPEMRIPANAVADLLEHAAAVSGCQTFGLRMAESRRLSDLGALSLLISHQATMRDALETVVHYRQLVNDSLLIQIEDGGELVVVREELVIPGAAPMRQAYELAIGVMHRLFRAVLGPRWRAHSVNFTHPAPSDLSVHRRVFGPIVEFGSDFNGFTCGRADLDAPNPSADPVLAQLAERYVRSLPNAERVSVRREVQKAIYLLLPTGRAQIGPVAASLGLNERTLQRRLASEGAEFTQLLGEVRHELTVRYLDNPSLPMSRLAGLVGFSRQTSFNRWFAGEFGVSPTAWRRRLAQEPVPA
jgi:AraC-like DNA-binding protein